MPAPGDQIGPYRFVSQLGKGAMGEVWRARDERLDRYVALKVLPAELAGDVERRARMVREARAAAAIRHANVVTLFDIVEHGGDDVLVMELVEGKTLSETLRREGPPALATGLAWIEGIADALAAAHASGILHRDLKAANIMIAGSAVKVLDFGLAKLRGDPVSVAAGSPDAPPAAAASLTRIALGDTLDATPIESYRTHAGQLLGTPLYMAPEQLGGGLPDERSEVFSMGVLAYEILAGAPPYSATSLDALFQQIAMDAPKPLERVPAAVEQLVLRALAKEPAARWPSMGAFRDAIAAERARRARKSRAPLAVGAAVLALAAAGVAWFALHRSAPAPAPIEQPGDSYVARALEEYDVFYGEKALSSLRAALRVAPDHARAIAYVLLFGGASEGDRDEAVTAGRRVIASETASPRDRALLQTALALAQHGPAAAAKVLAAADVARDRELAFWAAELDYRAGRYAQAGDAYRALLAEPSPTFRGRIYDHDSSVLLYIDDPAEALRIGTLYRDAFPGEADAVGVYATTLAAAGRFDEARAAAEEALRLNEGEDTLAGLAKVVALAGDHARAKELYQRSLDRAGAARRPLRRAALALLQWIDGDAAAATATVAPCLAGSTDADVRERGPCLFVAGVVSPASADAAAAALDQLAADATPERPAYGDPAALAKLVRLRARAFGGACVARPDAPPLDKPNDPADYDVPLDFYAAYHVPFFATWAVCEQAAMLAARGDRAAALAKLRPATTRAPHRDWLITAMKSYE